MAQQDAYTCPKCGAETLPSQKFCAGCGLTLHLPPASSPQSYQSSPLLQPQEFLQSYPPMQDPVYASVPTTQMRTLGRPFIVLILLLVLLVLGIASYVGLRIFGGIKATQPPITTTSINSTLNYAGVDITVINAQQSQSFLNDPDSASNGMVRLRLRAQNNVAVPVALQYNTIAHLQLPGKITVAPTYVDANVKLVAGATHISTIDFAVPSNVKISQLTLILGASNEAQVSMLLNGQTNIGQYAPKTVKPNEQMQYLGLNWLFSSATSQLSLNGQQASKGMRYVVVTLSVDNTLSQTAIPGSPFDYISIKTSNITITPVDSTLPVSFAAGVNGKMGTVTFLVPQTATTLTLLLASQTPNGFDQATADFQI